MIPIPEGVKVIESYPFKVGNLVVNVFGKEGKETNWKKELENLDDENTHAKVLSKAKELGATSIFCPFPVHGTTISSSKIKALGASRSKSSIYREVEADGADVEEGEAYALPSGDCPTVALHDPETRKTVAVHFNRENGIDNDILSEALKHFQEGSMDRLIAVIALSIGPTHFKHEWAHPKFGTKNLRRHCELMQKYGKGSVDWSSEEGVINLRWVAAKKLMAAGVQAGNIHTDLIDTYSDSGYWSHRAGDEGRNLVLVGNVN